MMKKKHPMTNVAEIAFNTLTEYPEQKIKLVTWTDIYDVERISYLNTDYLNNSASRTFFDLSMKHYTKHFQHYNSSLLPNILPTAIPTMHISRWSGGKSSDVEVIVEFVYQTSMGQKYSPLYLFSGSLKVNTQNTYVKMPEMVQLVEIAPPKDSSSNMEYAVKRFISQQQTNKFFLFTDNGYFTLYSLDGEVVRSVRNY